MKTIQKGINNASFGDTVFVYNGTYYENVVVNKTIDLIGEDKNTTIIDGTENGHVIQVTADNVNINGFTIQNVTDWPYKGIFVESENVNISNNKFKDLYYCIYILDYGNNVVYKNSFSKINSTIAIVLEESNYNNIISNTVSNMDMAIIVWEGHNNNISENILLSNGISIEIYQGGNSLVKNNIISTGYEGIELLSSNNLVIDNIISADDLAIHLNDNNNQIIHNDIYGDIFSYENYNNTFMFNNISGYLNFDYMSNNHKVLNNTFLNSNMELYWCEYNNISNNVFINGGIFSWHFSYNNTITNNLVNGKPLVYLENKSDIVIAPNAGQVILVDCSNITIEKQNLSDTHVGINLWDTDNCSVKNNNIISNNYIGIYLGHSNNNNITGNNLISNIDTPLYLHMFSNNNHLYHNNFINNTNNSYDQSNNFWDNGYPGGGNYWDDYTGTDTNGDGIGDTPYTNISGGSNQDNYPLMHPWGEVPILVDVDIKPGDYPNTINPKSKGKLPVAILTTEDFDAVEVDKDSIEFLSASPSKWAFDDVDKDGDIDIILHFKTQELNFSLLVDEGGEYPYAYLTGETISGELIEGKDTVRLVGTKIQTYNPIIQQILKILERFPFMVKILNQIL